MKDKSDALKKKCQKKKYERKRNAYYFLVEQKRSETLK